MTPTIGISASPLLRVSYYRGKAPLLIEVIVQTVADARAAEAGGADRLEIAREIECGGLTPALELIRAIASETSLPLRVMVRESDRFSVADSRELTALQRSMASLAELGVDGAVLGFTRGDRLDLETTKAVLSAAPALAATFHRAFDDLRDPAAAIDALCAVSQVDRILTSGGRGDRMARARQLDEFATYAAPRLTILAGSGVDALLLQALAASGCVREVHVGRAAREPQEQTAPVSVDRVRQLRKIAASRAQS
jgi:copper homeostasis protein